VEQFICPAIFVVTEAHGMHAPHTLREYRHDAAIAPHIIVIRRLSEPFNTCVDEPFDREGVVAPATRAVNHNPLHVIRL
jgi:hypothetical protein